ncbi:MAG: ribonuclease E/G [bacterium]
MTHWLAIEDGIVETRAAYCNAERVLAFWYGPGHDMIMPIQPGDLYRGQIKKIDRRLDAAFVDIGLARDGYFPLKGQTVSQGSLHNFRIKRLAEKEKGAIVTLVPEGQSGPVGRLSPDMTAIGTVFNKFRINDLEKVIINTSAGRTYLRQMDSSFPIEIRQTYNLFSSLGLAETLEQTLLRVISLENGAKITFDEAEAVTAIDIDLAGASGQSREGALMTLCRNIIPILMQQIIRRQISGQIVIDFPALSIRERKSIEKLLKEAIIPICGRYENIGRGGLFAFSLPKTGPSLLHQLTQLDKTSPIAGRRFTPHFMAARLIRRAGTMLADNRTGKFLATAAPDVIELIEKNQNWVHYLNNEFGPRIEFRAIPEFESNNIDVQDAG